MDEIVDSIATNINPYVQWLSNGKLSVTAVSGSVTNGRIGLKTVHGGTYEVLFCDERGFWGDENVDGWAFYTIHVSGFPGTRGGVYTYAYHSHRPLVPWDETEIIWLQILSRDNWELQLLLVSDYLRDYHLHLNPYTGRRRISEVRDFPGMPALQRYYYGWIDSTMVRVYSHGTTGSYMLYPSGASEVQMLVIPSLDLHNDTYMYILGVRSESSSVFIQALWADSAEDKQGVVEAYSVGMRGSTCTDCSNIYLDDHQFYPVIDVLKRSTREEESLWIEGNLVSIDEQVGDAFKVTVTPYAEIDWDSTTPWWEGHFRDDDGSVHEGAINALAEREIADGYADKTFNPNAAITRADMAVMLTRALGADPESNGDSRFTDIASDAPYGPAVDHLASIGVTKGYADGTFKPNAPVTRAQFASFIVRAFPQFTPAEEPASVFADVPAFSTHAATIEALYEAEVTRGCGTEPLRYCPSNLVKRGQAASFLARVLGLTS